jgi:hypothetical protein
VAQLAHVLWPDPGVSIALPMTNDYRLGRILERLDQVRAFIPRIVDARIHRMVDKLGYSVLPRELDHGDPKEAGPCGRRLERCLGV